jgi:hypothetical protein
MKQEPRRRRCVAIGFGAGAAPLGGVSAASPEVGCGAAVGGRDVAGANVDPKGKPEAGVRAALGGGHVAGGDVEWEGKLSCVLCRRKDCIFPLPVGG